MIRKKKCVNGFQYESEMKKYSLELISILYRRNSLTVGKKIMQYAYDLHVIVCKTFSRLSSAFDKVFREYLVQTVDRVKMAFSNLCRNDLTSVSLFA